MKLISSTTFAGAYQKLLTSLLHESEYEISPRDSASKEILNTVIRIDNPFHNLYRNYVRSSQDAYIAAELLWYFGGTNHVNDINSHAKFWNQIANSDGTVNSAYGYSIFTEKNDVGLTEWQWSLNRLQLDRNTRQAIIRFSKPRHSNVETKDFPCTIYGCFHIREGKLNFTIHMRSNDAILGVPTDIAFFTILQQQMLEHVQETIDSTITLGSYTHIVDSMHLYERHYALVEEMLKFDFMTSSVFSTTINMIDTSGELLENIKPFHQQFLNKEQLSGTRNSLSLINWILTSYELKQ